MYSFRWPRWTHSYNGWRWNSFIKVQVSSFLSFFIDLLFYYCCLDRLIINNKSFPYSCIWIILAQSIQFLFFTYLWLWIKVVRLYDCCYIPFVFYTTFLIFWWKCEIWWTLRTNRQRIGLICNGCWLSWVWTTFASLDRSWWVRLFSVFPDKKWILNKFPPHFPRRNLSCFKLNLELSILTVSLRWVWISCINNFRATNRMILLQMRWNRLVVENSFTIFASFKSIFQIFETLTIFFCESQALDVLIGLSLSTLGSCWFQKLSLVALCRCCASSFDWLQLSSLYMDCFCHFWAIDVGWYRVPLSIKVWHPRLSRCVGSLCCHCDVFM